MRSVRGTGKELPALIACLIWAGGFELGPALHLARHAELGPHDHDHSSGADHDHGEPERDHGEDSLAHRDLAASTALPALPPIDAPCLGAVLWDRLAPEAPSVRARLSAQARGPPPLFS